jgi:DNA repair exonuclease SbcCD ATPase subunit
MNLTQIKTEIYKAQGRKEEIEKQYNLKRKTLGQLEIRIPAIEEAQILLQATALEIQNDLKFHLEDIVQTGIDTCFSGEYSVYIEFENKRNKTECDIYLKNNNGNRRDPIDDNGGGLVDIVSFALRMACWTISGTDNIMIIDEPAKFISENLKPLFSELLKSLSEKLELQILMVTHDPEFCTNADKIFYVEKKNNISNVSEINIQQALEFLKENPI